MKYDVMAIADLFADVVIVGREKPEFGQVEKLADAYVIELGGSAPIFASQFAKLGGKIALVSVLGDDLLGGFLEQRMRAIGIDTQHIVRSKTRETPLGLNISVDGDRSLLTVLGALMEVSPALASEEIVRQTRHWHIAGYFLLEQLIGFWPSFLEGLRNKGITVSLDTNWAPTGNWRQVAELLPRVDVFLPNENEAMAITGKSDYRSAGIDLAKTCRLVVVKRGADGASAFVDGKEVYQAVPDALRKNLRVVDTTGAGDSFDGGFIFEWLRKAPLRKCLETGIVCGTSSVQCAGGINGQVVW